LNDVKENAAAALRVPLARPWFDDAEPDAARAVVESCWLIFGPKVAEFERRFAEMHGAKHGISMNSGSAALLAGMYGLGVGPGDEVLVPSHTFVATAAAVHWAGATPVLVDCGPDHLMDVEDTARKVTPRTRCVMPVQLNGRVCAMDRVLELATRQGLMVVEDAAQGFGASFQGRQAGSFGRAAAFSFYPAKLLGTFGDGGMVVTDEDDVAAAVTATVAGQEVPCWAA